MNRNTFPPTSAHALFLLLLLALSLVSNAACGGGSATSKDSDARPEITDEKIRMNIDGRMVQGVPEENNAAPPINWTFMYDEPKEFTVLEKQMNGDEATIVVEMKTRSAEGSRNPRHLSGKLRLHYELQSELITRQWRIVRVENISMKYKDEKKEEKKDQKKDQKEAPKEGEDSDESDERG